MPNTTEEQILTKLDKLTEMLDFALVQLRDTNLRLTEVIMRSPNLESAPQLKSAPQLTSVPARKRR
jgi:hypothetical protein